jgi:hypothetical protein
MSNQKFNSQTGYSADINNITSKVRLDFNTNVINPTNAILGVDETATEFVLIDSSKISTSTTDGIKNTNLSTLNGTMNGNVKTYVFEKLIDPSVVGCENCGDIAQYYPTGVNSSGQITDISVLPIVNKDVIAEFEISAEAYHSFEIDLVGHRRICDDSNKCYSDRNFWNNYRGQVLPNDYRTFFSSLNNEKSKELLSAYPYKIKTTDKFPPYNAPSLMSGDLSKANHHVIDYNCCKCCSYYEDYLAGTLTILQAEKKCQDSNSYYGIDSQFYNYCTKSMGSVQDVGLNLTKFSIDDLKPNSKTIDTDLSHCDLIKRKLEQFGSFPNPRLPNCLNSTYDNIGQPTELPPGTGGGCGLLIRCCAAGESEFIDNGDGTQTRICCTNGDEDPCCDTTCPCAANPCGNDASGRACPDADECGGNPCFSQPCGTDASGNPCPLNGTCYCNPSLCLSDSDSDSDENDGGGGGNGAGGGDGGGGGGGTGGGGSGGGTNCNFDQSKCYDCFCNKVVSVPTLAYYNIVDGKHAIVVVNTACTPIPSQPDLCRWLVRLQPRCNQSGCPSGGGSKIISCNEPYAVFDNLTIGGTYWASVYPFGSSNGSNSSCLCVADPCKFYKETLVWVGISSTLHNGDVRTTTGNTITNDFMLGRCKNVNIPNNVYKTIQTNYPCDAVPLSYSDSKNYCYLSANTYKNIFDDVSWNILGGHFFATKELRDYVYNQTGTVHFSTSVNSNFQVYKEDTKRYTIYHIDKINSGGTEYLLNYSYNTLTPAFWDAGNAYLSLGYGYSSNTAAGIPKHKHSVVNRSIYYDDLTSQNYLSRYQITNDRYFNARYVDTTKDSTILNINISGITPKAETTVSVASSTGTGTSGSFITSTNFNEWPLSNAKFVYTATGRQSSYLNSNDINWYNTSTNPPLFTDLYYNTITPLEKIYNPATNSSSSSTSYKQYLINNGIRQDYSFITDSREFKTDTENYENYKFFGTLINPDTIEINNSAVIFDASGNVISGVLGAKILYNIFESQDVNSQSDPKEVTVNAYTAGAIQNNKLVVTTSNEILNDGTLLQSYLKVPNTDINGSSGKIHIKLNKKCTRLGVVIPKTYYIMFKIISSAKGYTNSITYDKTGSQIITPNDGGSGNVTYKYEPIQTYLSRSKPSILKNNEFELFTIDSARFSTPDYSSYDGNDISKKYLYDQLLIPMRGLQYASYKKNPASTTGIISEVDEYPIIRTIRKNDGKFYIQILAGAFPYYHLLVHEPLIKKLDDYNGTTFVNDIGNSWRNKICNRLNTTSDGWWNYLATTKWTCTVKHTELAKNLPGWKRVNETSESGTGSAGKKPVVIGRNPTTAAIVAVGVPERPPLTPEDRENDGRGDRIAL